MEDNKWSPLMEQNWKRMQIILDQELPIKNDKRRNILAFLIIGGITFIFGLVLFLTYSNIKLNPNQNIQKPAFAEIKTIKELNFESADAKRETTGKNKSIFPTITKSISILTGIKEAIKYEGIDLSNIKDQISNIDVNYTYTKNTNTLSKTNGASDFEITKPISPPQPLSNFHSVTVEALTPKMFSVASDKKMNIISIQNITAQRKYNNGWHYGIKTSLSFNKFAPPNQYYTGIYLNRTIGKILIIEAQMGARFYNRYTSFLKHDNTLVSRSNDLLESSGTSVDNIFNLDSKILTNNAIAYANESIIRSTLTSAQYLESSLSLGFNVNSRITLKGGFSFGRFLNAEYTVDDASKSIYNAFNSTQNIESLNLNQANGLLKKWVTVGYFEADYRYFKRWTLTSSISIGGMNNALDYSDAAISLLANSSLQNTAISLDLPEKGTINLSVGVKYDLK